MKTISLLCASLLTLLAATANGAPRDIKVRIDNIEQGVEITGTVTGVPKSELSKYKVIVYVHTDHWYIHPYVGQGERNSWARIDQTGHWTINTEKRRFQADRVAALTVPMDYAAPSGADRIGEIPSIAATTVDLTKSSWQGRL